MPPDQPDTFAISEIIITHTATMLLKAKIGVKPLDFLSPSPWQLPTEHNAITNFDADQIARDALETTVIMHPKLPDLLTAFLAFKRTHGSEVERKLYNSLSQHDLVARLIKKRALHFVQACDFTVLRDGTVIPNGHEEWLRVGTADEGRIKLHDYLSYDEMMLASLLGTSGPTYFINEGARDNMGELDPDTPHQDRGIIIGLVGARFDAPGQMDSALCNVPVSSLRPQDPRLTKIFQNHIHTPDFDTSFVDEYPPDKHGSYNRELYAHRMHLTITTALLEADDRAAAANTTAHLFLPGLGLGVWRHYTSQLPIYHRVVAHCLEHLDLRHISTVELSWAECPAKERQLCIDAGAKHGIKVLVSSKRPPCAKLQTDELLVRVWAWDGNSLPGNEFWSGGEEPACLSSSDDPAAACCSTIAELHSPYVNRFFEHRIKVLQSRERPPVDVEVLRRKVLDHADDGEYFETAEGRNFRERVLGEVGMDAIFQDSRNTFAAEDVASLLDPLADSEMVALIRAVLVQEGESYGVEDEDGHVVFRRRKFVANEEGSKRLKLS